VQHLLWQSTVNATIDDAIKEQRKQTNENKTKTNQTKKKKKSEKKK
jgi:hypothetical protein